MGRSYCFECNKCGYRAQVAGRPDRGREFFTETIACTECKQLYDVVTRLRFPRPNISASGFQSYAKAVQARPPRRPPSFQAAVNRLPLKGVNGFRWVVYPARCPVSPGHRIRTWSDPGKCPKCGVFMEKAVLPYRIWD